MWLQIQDAKAGFLVNGFVTVSATVLVLEETVQLTRDGDGSADNLRCDIAWDSLLLCWSFPCHQVVGKGLFGGMMIHM